MAEPRILMIGVGGLGTATVRVLWESGFTHLTLVDDDVVEESNLHRQLLFSQDDIGMPKIEAAQRALNRIAPQTEEPVLKHTRFLPENALHLIEGHDLVIEGADNLATKFLAADAAHLQGVPVVHAGIVQWTGWALGHTPNQNNACLRCVFEDMPNTPAANCAEDGVIGPAVGVVAALQGALAIDILRGGSGSLWSYNGKAGDYRRLLPKRRSECLLCSGRIQKISSEAYRGGLCQA